MWAVSCLVAVLALLAAVMAWSRLAERRDLAGVPEQYGTAVVEEVSGSPPDRFARLRHPLVLVRLAGQLCEPARVRGLRGLAAGSRVRVSYRVGRSGRIHIDLAEPAGDSLPTPP